MKTKIPKGGGSNLSQTPSHQDPDGPTNDALDEGLASLHREIEEIRGMRDILKGAYQAIYPSGLVEAEEHLLCLERDHTVEQRDFYLYALECAQTGLPFSAGIAMGSHPPIPDQMRNGGERADTGCANQHVGSSNG